jgi:hypothetical protein
MNDAATGLPEILGEAPASLWTPTPHTAIIRKYVDRLFPVPNRSKHYPSSATCNSCHLCPVADCLAGLSAQTPSMSVMAMFQQ